MTLSGGGVELWQSEFDSLGNQTSQKMNLLQMKAQRVFCAVMAGIFSLCMLSGDVAAQDYNGRKISSVSIRYNGAKTVDEARLRNMMSVRAGQRYSAEKLDDDIRSMTESGLVDNVRIFATPRGGSVGLTVEVTTESRLGGVGFAGNTVFSDNKLAKEVDLKAGAPLSDAAIFKARESLVEYYEGYGYPEVYVSHRLQETDRVGFSDLIFTIEEGMKSEVRNIRFVGNESFADHTLANEMKTKEKGLLSFLTKSGRIDLDELDQDEERVLDFYRNKGYLRVRSNGFEAVPVEKDGRVDLVMRIEEGAQYRVGKISFGPTRVYSAAELGKVLTLNEGDAYSAAKMREDITTMRSYYGSRGYADAMISPEIRNAGPGVVNVIYRVTEGSRYKVGRVTIEGNNRTKDKVIRREIPLKPGDNFNSVDLSVTRKRLKNLNYFSNVVVEGEPSNQKGYRDINVVVDEKKTGSVSFGLGFSSIDNVVGYVNLEQTNFDITNPWKFTGGGQRFGMNLRVGAERRDFKISLVEPWFMGKRLSLGGELFYRDQLYLSDEYEQRNVGGAVFIRKPVGNKAYIRAEYRLEQIRVDVDDDVGLGSRFNDFGGDFLKSSIGLNYVYDSRDALTTPRKGHKVDLGVNVAGQFLGGDVDTITLTAQGSKHWNLWFDSILTLEGAAAVVEADGDTPIFDRQFLGGARNLRGFEFRDVGPRDAATNEVFGGNSSAYGSVEWTFPIVETVRGAVFADAGFVNEESFDFSPSDLYTDAGVGLRLNLPFGPLALDYAVPLSSPDDEADNGAQFNFYLNYEF